MLDAIAILREEFQATPGFADCAPAGETLCPVRDCGQPVTRADRSFGGAVCQGLHTAHEMLDLVEAEMDMLLAPLEDAREARLAPIVDALEQVWQMRSQLRASINGGEPLKAINLDSVSGKLAPRYPSGVAGLETYGNTLILAEGGVGKSLLAIGIAMETAATSMWSVAYFNAEIDAEELKVRVSRYAAGMTERTPQFDFMRWIAGGDQTTIPLIVDEAALSVCPSRKLLVVIDSINSFAEFAADDRPGADLNETRRLYNWATQVRKETLGQISFLIVSETNASGGVKGRKGFFSADVVVHLAPTSDREMVNINVLKSRSGQGGDLGVFTRNYRNGRFER